MELRAAIKILRKELNMTQTELAKALGLAYCSVNRWENDKGVPNSSTAERILELARNNNVSGLCQMNLEDALAEVRHKELNLPDSKLYEIERESICQLVDDALSGVYVCDYETDELLYMNHRAEEYFKKRFNKAVDKGQKCYNFIAGLDKPCSFCYKSELNSNYYTDNHIVSAMDGRNYHIRGKLIKWNGRLAHVQYVNDVIDDIGQQDGFNRVMDIIPAGICAAYVFDDGNIELAYINNGYYEMISTTREQRIKYSGLAIMNAIHKSDRERVREQIISASKNKESFNINYRLILNNGTFKWMNVQGRYTIKTDNRSIYCCVIVDIDQLVKKIELK